MFPNYKGKLLAIIWMGIGAAILSSIFSAIIIGIVAGMNKRMKKLSQS
ncbi:hypothetical protein ABEW00_17370 [Rossellomorea vietnamensis]